MEPPTPMTSQDDEDLVNSLVSGEIPSYALEYRIGDCYRDASIRREAVQRLTGRYLDGLPMEDLDYQSILGQCYEMPIGYVQIPVGIDGPLLINGGEYSVPMETTEGCLVASTNRGCKAIYASGGATTVLFRDGMTRDPVVKFRTASRASELLFFLEEPANFDTLAVVFYKVEQICQVPEDSVLTCREKSLHQIQLWHRGCHGNEHGIEGCSERSRFSSG